MQVVFSADHLPRPLRATPQPHLPRLVLTESQNVRGWKGPRKLIQCNPPMEQEHPDEVTQEGVQAGWNVCTEGDSTTSLGSLGQALPPSPGTSFFSNLNGTSCVPVCTHCPLSCHWLSPEEPGSILLTLPLSILIPRNESPLSLLLSSSRAPAPSAFPHTGDAPLPSASWWLRWTLSSSSLSCWN